MIPTLLMMRIGRRRGLKIDVNESEGTRVHFRLI